MRIGDLVSDLVMPGQWEDSPVYGIAVVADEELMHVQNDKVKAAIEAKADQPIHDEPAPPTAPVVDETAQLSGLKPGWGAKPVVAVQRPEEAGVAAKTGWGSGGVPMPSFGSWADDD